jgi:hypothetical protein
MNQASGAPRHGFLVVNKDLGHGGMRSACGLVCDQSTE